MRKQNKRHLYESIMRDVANVVKRRLNEGIYDFDSTNSYDDVDDILYGEERSKHEEERSKHEYEIIDKIPVEGLRRVRRKYDGKFNFINADGRLIFEDWLYYCRRFNEDGLKGYALVHVERGLYNYMDKNGMFLSRMHFNYCSPFYPEGYAMVMIQSVRNHKNILYNIIDNKGRVVFDKWVGNIKKLYDAAHQIEYKLSRENIID